jgi:hypothetical protein
MIFMITIGRRPILEKSMTWEKYSSQEKQARGKKMCMQRRKACEAHMQEDLTMLGLWFW